MIKENKNKIKSFFEPDDEKEIPLKDLDKNV